MHDNGSCRYCVFVVGYPSSPPATRLSSAWQSIKGLSCMFNIPWVLVTARFLYRAGAETPVNLWEKFRAFPRTILENFSAVDTQTAVLVSTAEVWISAPDTQTPIFLGFLGIHSWVWFFCRETKSLGFCFLRCLSRKSGSQHQLRIKTLPSSWRFLPKCAQTQGMLNIHCINALHV